MGFFSKECTCTHDILKQQFDDYKAEIRDNYSNDIATLRSNLDKIAQTFKNNLLAEVQQKLEEDLVKRFSDFEEKLKAKGNGRK